LESSAGPDGETTVLNLIHQVSSSD